MPQPSALGIDLGTSALKAVLVDGRGRTLAAAAAGYLIDQPQPGWAEQDPEAWWQAAGQALRALGAAAADLAGVRAVGLSGQMHGTVVLDRVGRPLRPAIIWADARAAAEAAALTAGFRQQGLAARLGGAVAPGFMAATLAWLRQHEPVTWRAMASCLSPKDALRLRLTGGPPATEASDASATLLLDLERRDWSPAALAQLGLRPDLLPPVGEAGDVAGALAADAARELGLPAGIPVIAGGSDQGMACLSAGVLAPGDLLLSISSGGQVVAPLERPVVDPELRAHTFCHVLPGASFAQAATLSAGLALRWLREGVLGGLPDAPFAALVEEAAALPPGAEGLVFLPYLLGERTPHLDPAARGLFAGLALGHGRAHLLRAVLEGVAFSLREALDVLRSLGVRPRRLVGAGGGMRLPLWRQIVADVLGRPLLPLATADQSALGAALLAGVAARLFPDPAAAAGLAVAYDPPVPPRRAAADYYARAFPRYRALYAAVARWDEAAD